jgi:hypothetical protein
VGSTQVLVYPAGKTFPGSPGNTGFPAQPLDMDTFSCWIGDLDKWFIAKDKFFTLEP